MELFQKTAEQPFLSQVRGKEFELLREEPSASPHVINRGGRRRGWRQVGHRKWDYSSFFKGLFCSSGCSVPSDSAPGPPNSRGSDSTGSERVSSFSGSEMGFVSSV